MGFVLDEVDVLIYCFVCCAWGLIIPENITNMFPRLEMHLALTNLCRANMWSPRTSNTVNVEPGTLFLKN